MALSDTITKATHEEARYTRRGTKTEHCGICRYFIGHDLTCRKITGHVVPGGWCKFFDKAD